MELTYYDFTRSKQSGYHLLEFKKELANRIGLFSNLEITNGEEKSRDTYRFIDHMVNWMDSEIHVEDLEKIFLKVSNWSFDFIKDKYPWAYRFFEDNPDIDKNEVCQTLKAKTFISVRKNGIKIKNHPNANGLTCGCWTAVVIRSHKNIIWHETAHLFGAEDHYVYADPRKMEPKCTEKELCVMQWDPGDKQCRFCSKALEEMEKPMSIPRTQGPMIQWDLRDS